MNQMPRTPFDKLPASGGERGICISKKHHPTHADYSETYTKKSGFLSSRTSHSISQNHADTTVGSQLVGDSVTTLSTGDTTIKGSTVFGTNGVDMISTDGNINLQTSEDRFNNHNYRKDTKSGFGALGGLSFGKMSNEQGRTGDQIGHTGSTVASLNGDVNLSARQGNINVQASDINSQNANVDLQAQQINLTDVHNTATVDQYTKYKSAGLSVSASVAGINAVQSTAQAGDLLGQAANGSQSIAAGASSALAAYGAYREVKGLVNGISGLASAKSATDVAGALGASVSVSLGVQKSESKSHSEQSTSAGSSVTAGGTVKLTATGKGADSDINLTHATVAGAQGTHLKAEGDILAQAGVNTAHVNNSNKSSGASIGVSFGANGFTLNLSANGGKGVANGDETTYSETTIGNANSNTTLSSGADTTFDGAIVQGKRVKADVGGNLTINTPQDVSHYDSKQTSYGVGVSIPLGAGGFSVSGSYSNDKVNANTNTTQEIAGIYAGEGGYDIQVKGNTTIDAGVIASTATPDNNQLTTSTLVLKDKANQSAYDANSVGLSASYSGKQTTTDANGNTVPKMITNDKGEQVQAQGGTVKGFGANLPSTMSASDDASSTTRAAISAGNIRITNDAAQQQLTGQTAEQTLASINHDTANNATLANLYEQDKDKIQTGFAIGKGLSQNFASFMNDMAKDMDSVAKSPAVGKDGKPIIKDGKQLTNQEAYQAGLELGDTVNKAGDTINYGTRQDLWGSGGTGNRIATALIGAYSGNVSNGASTLLQNTALNVVRTYGATEIKHLADGFSTQTDDKGNPIPNATSETVRGLLHAIAGCAGASATGGDCASAGLASAGTVAMNNAMTALLNLNPNDMTDTQKQAYSNLIGTLVAGVSTAVGGDAAAASLASRVEVDDNYLNYQDKSSEVRAGNAADAAVDNETRRAYKDKEGDFVVKDKQQTAQLNSVCKDISSQSCKREITRAWTAYLSYAGGLTNNAEINAEKAEIRKLLSQYIDVSAAERNTLAFALSLSIIKEATQPTTTKQASTPKAIKNLKTMVENKDGLNSSEYAVGAGKGVANGAVLEPLGVGAELFKGDTASSVAFGEGVADWLTGNTDSQANKHAQDILNANTDYTYKGQNPTEQATIDTANLVTSIATTVIAPERLLALKGASATRALTVAEKTELKAAGVEFKVTEQNKVVFTEPEADFAGRVPVRPKDGSVTSNIAQVGTPIGNHLINAKIGGSKQNPFISGGHNSNNFYEILDANNGKVVGQPTPVSNGIVDVKYQLPNGKIETKTIYDPKVYSDAQMASMANDAAAKAIVQFGVNGETQQIITINGITFRVPISEYKGKLYVPSTFPINPKSPW